ncbi:hypothetical protein HGM15179_018461 [Zosterops borbonicus]|uniref:Reverse transcriptase n=1 Tax=Zosterops borbonicus TaxID=364589 RepID=A0A8K1FYZ7_9PASS|nr:hypothetical protein HGM15179_018461 [Zosterops borbonicus]
MPPSSKMDLPLAKAKAIRNGWILRGVGITHRCDPMESLCWSRLLAGTCGPMERVFHAREGFLGWKQSPSICHGLIQTVLEKGEAPEHIDDIIIWGNTAEEDFEKGEKIIQALLKAGFAIKQSKVKGPAQELQFLGAKCQDGRHQIPRDVVNKIAAVSPLTSKKEIQAFLGAVSFWRMHIPDYRQIVNALYHVIWKKNDFKCGPEQQQAFEQIKQEIFHGVALGPVRTGQNVKNVLYTAARENGPS